MGTRNSRRTLALGIALLTALVLGACGSSSGGGEGGQTEAIWDESRWGESAWS